MSLPDIKHRKDDRKEESEISRTILLATDGSLPALAATIRAVEIAHDKKAKLVVLSVKEQTPITRMEKLAEDAALGRLADVDGIEYARKAAARLNVSAEFLTREGPVVGQILQTASEKGADIIVIGSSDPRGISGFILGNVADTVVRQATCSVMVIKPGEAEIKAAFDLVTDTEAIPQRIDISDITGSKKFKIGLVLFTAYLSGYTLFTVVGSFDKSVFRHELLGLNVALISGMALIGTAIAMAIGYNWYVGQIEAKKGGV